MFSKKVVDNRKKNTTRVVTESVKDKVYTRDNWQCVICHKWTKDEFHHARYGADSLYDESKNTPEEIVLLCHPCHHELHFGSGNTYRQDCIDYLKKYE